VGHAKAHISNSYPCFFVGKRADFAKVSAVSIVISLKQINQKYPLIALKKGKQSFTLKMQSLSCKFFFVLIKTFEASEPIWF